MKTLLIIAHGSRRKESNEEVLQLAERIATNSDNTFDRIASSFLEISSPQVDFAIADLAKAGATEIVIFPYFLAAGTHVANDIPRLIDEGKAIHPHIQFEVLPHLGALKGISTLILDHLNADT